MITYTRFSKKLLGDMTLNEIYFFVTDYSNILYKVQEDLILEGIPLELMEVKYGVSIDNARIRELFNLTDDDHKSLIEYQESRECTNLLL
jgi:hypothetical protein